MRNSWNDEPGNPKQKLFYGLSIILALGFLYERSRANELSDDLSKVCWAISEGYNAGKLADIDPQDAINRCVEKRILP